MNEHSVESSYFDADLSSDIKEIRAHMASMSKRMNEGFSTLFRCVGRIEEEQADIVAQLEKIEKALDSYARKEDTANLDTKLQEVKDLLTKLSTTTVASHHRLLNMLIRRGDATIFDALHSKLP